MESSDLPCQNGPFSGVRLGQSGRWVQKIVYVGEVLEGFGDFWGVLGQLGVGGCRRLYTLGWLTRRGLT